MTTRKLAAPAGGGKRSWRNVLKIHEAAAAYPPLPENELRELAEDIRVNGLQAPIVLYREGEKVSVLDGVHRLDALEKILGIDLISDGKLVPGLGLGKWACVYTLTDVDPVAQITASVDRTHL
jgi:hypothetical protein